MTSKWPSPVGTRLLLVAPDGVGVRNFVHGRFPSVWRQAHGEERLEICSGVPTASLRDVAGDSLAGVRLHEMPIYYETPGVRFVRKSLEVAHLSHFHTAGMRNVLVVGAPRGRSRSAQLNRLAHLAGRLMASKRGIAMLGRLHMKRVGRHTLTGHYRTLLNTIRPSIVFFTHQRPPQIFPLAVAARKMGIATACFIFSWDNLSSKGRMPVSFDHYLVWSGHMRSELLQFYPDVQPQQVHVVGTPQFEPYAYSDFGWSEEQLCRETGARIAHKRLCFSAGDASTSPNDPFYIEALATAMREGAFGEDIEIIVRPSPAEEGTRFAAILEKYPEVIWCPPRWVQTRAEHPEPWSQRVPCASDIDLLKSLTLNSDININMASTMTLDFAFADKPVVNVGFGGAGAYSKWFNDLAFYNYEHYRAVLKLGSARLARNTGELVNAVKRYLEEPGLDNEGRARLLKMQVSVPLLGTSERVSQALVNAAGTYGTAHGRKSR